MKFSENSQIDSEKIGVYQIRNISNQKVYIGSTTQSFKTRYKQHLAELIKMSHKNTHLQNSWNKCSHNFVFEILDICDAENCLDIEQKRLDALESYNSEKGYNINKIASGTSGMPQHIINKRSQTFKNTNREAMVYYYMCKKGEITIHDVPTKYLKLVSAKLNNTIWNKGIKLKNTDHLKVPKKKTDKYHQGRKNFKETQRTKSPGIDIYDHKGTYITSFRSVADIVEYSKCENNLPLILRTEGGKGKSFCSGNIYNVCAGRIKHYKGLIFRYKNSDIPVLPLSPKDIHSDWTEFKSQCAASESNFS